MKQPGLRRFDNIIKRKVILLCMSILFYFLVYGYIVLFRKVVEFFLNIT